jgi:hypothetical protein
LNVGNCKDPTCGRPMVGRRAYRSQSLRGRFVRHGGHGLCLACYIRARSHKTLPEPAPRNLPRSRHRPLAEWIEDYPILRRNGATHDEIAEEVGLTRAAFDRAIQRARKSGKL